MPKIAEIKEIDGELWCRVGKLGQFARGISLWTPDEREWHRRNAYLSGVEDGKAATTQSDNQS